MIRFLLHQNDRFHEDIAKGNYIPAKEESEITGNYNWDSFTLVP